jgi:glycosyltransferase involved in cell wall biosynthesis
MEADDLSLEPVASRVPQFQNNSARRLRLPSVTIAICTRNRPDDLNTCLNAISRLNPRPDEILVVDNSEGDRATEEVTRDRGVRYVVEPAAGLSRARNRALAESRCEIVAYMDDDALPSEDWLEQILAPFDDSQVASVSGPVFAPGVPRNAAPAPVRSLTNHDPQWFEIATFGGMGWGSNMALRRSVYSTWKGFDVRLGKGAPLRIAEESHAFASLLALGYRAAFVPAAVIYHPVKPWDAQQEAISSFAYWMLLLCEFPGHRLDLIRFLTRRLRGKRITWPRDPQTPGQIISSGWRVRLKAGLAGTLLYLRSRKLRVK